MFFDCFGPYFSEKKRLVGQRATLANQIIYRATVAVILQVKNYYRFSIVQPLQIF